MIRKYSNQHSSLKADRGIFFPFCFIMGWWTLAFFYTANPFQVPSITSSAPLISSQSPSLPNPLSSSLPLLSPLNREEMHSALAGNIPLMVSLMQEWDFDAKILKEHAITGIRRLPKKELNQIQIFARQIKTTYSETTLPSLKLLPQTYAAASFLLALTEPTNIVALPQGFRDQKSLYPETLTKRIPLDTHRHHTEKLYKTHPDIAFVADYSHPALLEALAYQGIPLFTLKSIQTVSEVKETIQTLGTVIHRPLEAALLASFIKAAMFAIDNRLLACHSTDKRIMILDYYAHYSVPTAKKISGDLLTHLKELGYLILPEQKEPPREWAIPISEEQIVASDPDCLIIATVAPSTLKKQIETNPALQHLSAAKKRQIYCIEGAPQTSTQYIVLAYYDLAQALMDCARLENAILCIK